MSHNRGRKRPTMNITKWPFSERDDAEGDEEHNVQIPRPLPMDTVESARSMRPPVVNRHAQRRVTSAIDYGMAIARSTTPVLGADPSPPCAPMEAL